MFAPEECLNKEQWLELAFSRLSEYPKEKTSWAILRWYVALEFGEQDESQVMTIIDELYSGWIARNMCDKGLLEYDFEKKNYRVTQLGQKLREGMRS